MSALTRTGITQALAALMSVGLAISFWLWVGTPEILNGFVNNSRVCSVQQIVNFPPETDFVALGSSRVRRGISPETLIDESGGLIQYPMNLGRAGAVPYRNLSMLREVLARENDIKYVYFEVNIKALTGKVVRTRLFFDKAFYALVARANYGAVGSALSELPASERLRALLMLEFLKIKHGLVMLFTGVTRQSNAKLAQPAPSVCWEKNFDRQSRRKIVAIKQAERKNIREFGLLDEATRDFELSDTWAAEAELNLLTEIRDLAEANNIELVIGRPSAAFEPPFSNEALARIRLLLPEFEQPPATLVRELWKDYLDVSHMDKPARDAYTAWLAEIFLSRSN